MPAVHGDLASSLAPTENDLPPEIYPRQVTLRDRVTVATLIPFVSHDNVPRSLQGYLSEQLNKEIEKGDTYAMIDPIPFAQFSQYWFSGFSAIMILGDIKSAREMHGLDRAGANWAKICLGSFNVRPNYPGRSSHVCNGMFLVTDAARNRGVGRLMGEGYLEWAPKLGYTYAVFNLVYESNVASCRLWDSLGFKRIGRVPGGGRLISNPGQYVDAIIYGRDLGPDGEDSATQDRFDKIRYYLKHSKYPRGADRAEKSRLRSAATHYKLIGGDDGETEKLMLKDKEVVSDPQQQYDIAKELHEQQHAGINKTTAAIAVKYHWVRIKETVSRVIRDCPQCKETLKAPVMNGVFPADGEPDNDEMSSRSDKPSMSQNDPMGANSLMDHTALDPHHSQNPFATPHPSVVQGAVDAITDYAAMPLDPQMQAEIHQQLSRFHQGHDEMPDPYAHAGHGLPSTGFDEDVRNHAHEYHMMVDDPSDPDAAALHQEALGLVHSQPSDVHHDQLLAKYQYVGQPDDDLDFT
ncbi:histone acetyltransferase Spt10 [Aspergillus ambiguus]|uniref:putative histone acetyltransferase Spt10 n=1 Tax=Aspergillus ambiguus TaxID=176160 RepID=UPI003CCCCC8C